MQVVWAKISNWAGALPHTELAAVHQCSAACSLLPSSGLQGNNTCMIYSATPAITGQQMDKHHLRLQPQLLMWLVSHECCAAGDISWVKDGKVRMPGMLTQFCWHRLLCCCLYAQLGSAA